MKMGKPWKCAVWAAAAVVGLTASQAFADIQVISVQDSNSWIATIFVNTGPSTGVNCQWDSFRIDAVQIGQSSDSPTHTGYGLVTSEFETPNVITNPAFPNNSLFTAQGWAQTGTPTNLTATATKSSGGPTTAVMFDVNLTPGTNGVAKFFITFFDSTMGGDITAKGYVAVEKTSSSAFNFDSHVECVPVPAALWTGLPMLGGMMLLLRRRKQRMLV